MLYVQTGTEFAARLLTTPGLVGVTARVVDGAEELVAPVAAVESPAGTYTVTMVAPGVAVDGHAYVLVWDLPALPDVTEDLVVSVDVPAVNVAALPDVSEVAALVRARTRNRYGREAGTFTEDTRPTRGQVLALMGLAQSHVAGVLGFGTLSDGLARMSRTAVAIRTAMLVELSYFPEQVQSGRSPYEHLRDLYETEVERLKVAALDDDLTDGVGATDDARLPRYSVPRHDMTTFDRQW